MPDSLHCMKKTGRVALIAASLCVCWLAKMPAVVDGRESGARDTDGHLRVSQPALANVCLVTSDVKRLVDFYEPVLALKARWSGKDYAEFRTGVGVLAIFAAEAQEKYIPGSVQAAENRSVILEFNVADVGLEYKRLQSLVKVWVKPPTTQPWGTRSIYFRDPDGNLVDFFTPAKR